MDDKKKSGSEEEPKVKMYRLRIDEEIEAESIDVARKAAPERLKFISLDKEKIEASISRVVRKKYSSRADRLAEARTMIEDAKSIVEELKDEVQEWHDNLPENLQQGDKGSALEECVQNLESVESSLDEADSNCESVEFPGMFG